MEEIKVTLLTEDKARLENIEGTYWIYYNTMAYKANSTIQLEVEVAADTTRIKSGCMACTLSSIVKSEGNKHTIEITYDTINIGDFMKTVTFFHTLNGVEQATTLRITGNVSR